MIFTGKNYIHRFIKNSQIRKLKFNHSFLFSIIYPNMTTMTEIPYNQLYQELQDQKQANALLTAKVSELEEIIKSLKLSNTNSSTAKNGYTEEESVCNDLNTNFAIRENSNGFLPMVFDKCSRIQGNHKVDIASTDRLFTAQVKKYKEGQFQQLDRHWVDDLIAYIPSMVTIQPMMKAWCEIPLLPDGKNVDKEKDRVLLSNTVYSDDVLNQFLATLETHKMQILEYAFYGANQELKPNYLIGAEYKNEKRHKLIFYKVDDIIAYLHQQSFSISKTKSVIQLGKSLSMQRKGGDGGKKGSNQMQFKIIVSSLPTDIAYTFEIPQTETL